MDFPYLLGGNRQRHKAKLKGGSNKNADLISPANQKSFHHSFFSSERFKKPSRKLTIATDPRHGGSGMRMPNTAQMAAPPSNLTMNIKQILDADKLGRGFVAGGVGNMIMSNKPVS